MEKRLPGVRETIAYNLIHSEQILVTDGVQTDRRVPDEVMAVSRKREGMHNEQTAVMNDQRTHG